MPSKATAKASPTSRPLIPPPDRIGAGRAAGVAFAAGAGAGVAGVVGLEAIDAGAAAAGEGAAGRAGGAGAAVAAGVAALAWAAAGAAADGMRIEGPPAGFGGRLILTVCFFWAASAGFGGSGVGEGGGTGLFSDIMNELFATLGTWPVRCQSL